MEYLIFLLATAFTIYTNDSNAENGIVKTNEIQYDSTVYVNNVYKMVLFRERKKMSRFKLYNLKNSFELEGRPELIIIDGEIPEGTNRIDYNNPSDYRGYECDSSYRFNSKKINIAFAVEKTTKKRLDLSIYDSVDKNFKDGSYTLIKQ